MFKNNSEIPYFPDFIIKYKIFHDSLTFSSLTVFRCLLSLYPWSLTIDYTQAFRTSNTLFSLILQIKSGHLRLFLFDNLNKGL